MKLYISGPMSGIEDDNFPAFRAAAEKLRAAGYQPEDPSAKGRIDGWEWKHYLAYDLKIVVDCDGVATLPGWLNSRGANLEVKTARALEIPVFPIDHWLAVADPLAERERELLELPPPPMTLNDLRQHAHEKSQEWFPALHERPVDFLIQSALGLAGETGEAVDVIKKAHRNPKCMAIDKAKLGPELADVFVYLLHLCTAVGIDLEAEYLAKSALNETRFGQQSVTQGG